MSEPETHATIFQVPADALARILVVDDEPMVLGVVGATLEMAGYTVIKANDAREGIAACEVEQLPVDLAIVDYYTPGMKGPELCLALRERYPGIKVIVMSGHAEQLSQMVEQDAAFAQDIAILPKPFLPNQLLAVVKAKLAGAPSHRLASGS